MKKSVFLSVCLSQIMFLLLFPTFQRLFSYLHTVVLVVVWFCLTISVSFLIFFIRKTVIKMPYLLFSTVLSLYTICLIILLFFRPNEQSYDSWNLIPFQTISFYFSGEVNSLIAVYNLAANIGLFIPYGILLMISVHNKLNRFSISLSSICFIEFIQFFTHRGSLDIDDIILNVLGIYIGIIFYPIFNKVVHVEK